MRGNDTTSVDAAESMRDFGRIQRTHVLAALLSEPDGLTRDGLSERTGIKIQSICPAVHSLLRDGVITETAQRRMTRSGRGAYILVAKRRDHPA